MKRCLGNAGRRGWRVAGAAVVLAALAACGGGGGGGAAGPGGDLATGLGAVEVGGAAGASPALDGLPVAAQLQPGDFILNGATADDQGRVAAAALHGGGFVAVWSSDAGGAGSEVRLQRFGGDARALGDEVVVAASGRSAGVTALADGGFLVSWSASPYTSEANGYGQRFDANGQAVGGTVQLAVAFYKYAARPLGLADGGYALAADTITGRYGTEFGEVTRYAADGTPVGTPVRLVSQLSPQTGALDPNRADSTAPARWADGRFAVAWVASGSDVAELRLSRFDAQAQLVGTETIVRDTRLQQPALAVLTGGQLALSWVSGPADGAKALWLEVFGPDGASLGRQAVAEGLDASSVTPRVAALGDGGFALGWRTDRDDATALQRTVTVQRFGAGGQRTSAPEQLAANSVPADAAMSGMDSLDLVGGAGSSFLVLHGTWSASGGWDIRASAR